MRVARSKRVMFLIRDPADGDTAWSEGEYDPSSGYVIKYPREYQEAQESARELTQQGNT